MNSKPAVLYPLTQSFLQGAPDHSRAADLARLGGVHFERGVWRSVKNAERAFKMMPWGKEAVDKYDSGDLDGEHP